VGHLGREDLAELVGALDGHVVIDLVGYEVLRALAGIEYVGFCW